MRSGGKSEEEQEPSSKEAFSEGTFSEEPSSEGAYESESVIIEEGLISNEAHLSREREGSSQNQQRTSSTPELQKGDEDEGESGQEGAKEKVKDQTDGLSVLGNKALQNTLIGEETIERTEEDSIEQFVDSNPSEKERLKDKLKQTPESSSG